MDVSPVPHLALTSLVVAGGGDPTVGVQAHRVPVAAADRDQIPPAGQLQLPLPRASGTDRGAVVEEPDAEPPACRDVDHRAPLAHLALAVVIPPRGQDPTVRGERQAVAPAGVASRVDIARGHGHHLAPVAGDALAGGAVSGAGHGAVATSGERVATARGHR